MSGLLLMKALNLICAAEDKHYVKGKKKFVKQMTHGSKSHRALGSIGAGTDAIPTTSPELLAARQTFSPTPALPRHLPPVAGADFRAALGPCLRSISRRFAWYVPSRQAAGTSRDHSVAATTVPPPARIDECSFVAEETRKVFKSFDCNGDGKISATAALSSSVQSLIDTTAVAIKIIDKSQADAAMEPHILREISAMRRLLLHSPSALRCSSFCARFIRHPPCSAPANSPSPSSKFIQKKNIIENGIVSKLVLAPCEKKGEVHVAPKADE
ncbi:hypothetical protein ACFX2J_032846 [Malus domestica]